MKKKWELDEAITVKELIDLLSTFDQDLPVGVTGNFGEFIKMNKYDFYEKETYSVRGNWSDNNRKHHKCLTVESPDIGPDLE